MSEIMTNKQGALAVALLDLRAAAKDVGVTYVILNRDGIAAVLGHVESFQRREHDLLEANNRYLERARAAERGVLTSEDGEFQIIASEAVKVAHMVNLFEWKIQDGSIGTFDAGELLYNYCTGNADEDETMREIREC
jgi:hypothetical protein